VVRSSQSFVLDDQPQAVENDGYLMIQRFHAQNFRCFDSLQLDGLRRFNFVVGESGSGKSALLESIFLLSAANPELYFRIRRTRGFGEGNLELQANKESFTSLFRFLFHNGDISSIARLSLHDNYHGNRKLDIYFEGQQSLTIPLNKPENAFVFLPLSFKWDVGNLVKEITLELKDGSIKGTGSVLPHPVHFISPRNVSSRYDAFLFSSLSRSMKIQKVIEVIQRIYPYVLSLSLEIIGGETLIGAQIEGTDEKFPINDLSGGLNKLISIALAIASNPSGIILIDEIENGFYYKNYREVMNSVIALCEEYSVQLFASTHSAEFLTSAAEALETRTKDFLLLRTKYAQNKSEVTRIEGRWSLSAIEQNAEVRG
jgi:ABC-type lipoprotein export system ATPase subunit